MTNALSSRPGARRRHGCSGPLPPPAQGRSKCRGDGQCGRVGQSVSAQARFVSRM